MAKRKQKRQSNYTNRDPYSIIFNIEDTSQLDIVKKTILNFYNMLDKHDHILVNNSSTLDSSEIFQDGENKSDNQKIKFFHKNSQIDFEYDLINEQIILVSAKNLVNEISFTEILHQNLEPGKKVKYLNFTGTGLNVHQSPVLSFNKELILNNLSYFNYGNDFHNTILFLINRFDWDLQPLILPKSVDFKLKKKFNISQTLKIISLWHHWLIKQPFEDIFKNKKITFENNAPLFRLLFVFVALLSLIIMSVSSGDAGISGDEPVNYRHAAYVYDYFTEGDSTALNTPKTKLQYYGQSFDNLTYLFNKVTNAENYYETRHFFNSLTGWLAMLFTGLIVVYLMGWRAGALAFILILFSPRFLGHSWNNPKDIPFAFTYIFCLFYQVKLLAELPRFKLSTLIILAFGIGLSISVRIGGLLLIAYQFMFLGLYTIFFKPFKNTSKPVISFINSGLVLAMVSIAGYFLGLVLWPYALEDPIKNPLESLQVMTNFTASLKQAFMGDFIWSDNVPWYYTPTYILITTPIIILVGILLYFLLIWKYPRKKVLLSLFVSFAFVFPIFYIIYKSSNVYGGWRHVLFVYAPLVAISSIGLNAVINQINQKYRPYTLFAVILLLIQPVYHTFKNHPYQYIYFNQLAGGINGAYGNYEMDYYYHSLKESSKWLINNEIDTTANKKTIVATNHAEIVKYYFREYTDHVTITYVRFYDRGNYNWDYAIIANSYINPYQQKNGYWPPAHTIHEIKVNKAVVGAVIERKDKNDHLGYQAMKEKNYFKAEVHLKKALEANPNNEVARINLAKLYIDQNRLNEANGIVNGTLKIYHNYDKALNLLGIIYLKKREFNNALGVFNRITQVNPKFVNAYHNIGVVLLNQKKNQQALNYFQKALKVNSKYKPSYMAIAHILRQAGKEEEAQRYVDAANNL